MFVHHPIPNDDRPNIIFIITDQQRYDTIAGLGYDHMDTPNLDRLVREGISFEQCHVTAASCAAARASLFKGYYPHTTGISEERRFVASQLDSAFERFGLLLHQHRQNAFMAVSNRVGLP